MVLACSSILTLRENSNILVPATIAPEASPVFEDAPLTTSLVAAALTAEAVVNALKFGSRPPSVRPALRRRETPSVDLQFPLF